MAARSRHPTLSPTTPKRVHQQDTTPTPPTSYLNGGAKPPNPHSGRLPKKRVHQQDTTPTSPTSNLNGGAKPPPHTQPDNPKARSSTSHNANIYHLLSQWRRAAATPHSARQPQSAFINKTQRQHLPPPISMAARNRPTTYLITVVKAVRAPQHLPSDNPNCELIVRQGATTSRFQFLWMR